MSTLPPPSPRPVQAPVTLGRRGPTRGVVIGILVAVAVVAAAIVAVTILGSDDDDSASGPTDEPTTDSSTTVPTTSTAMDLPTAAAAARIDELVDESGVGDDGRYSIEDQECPLADVTVRGLVDAMLALGDGSHTADGPVTATVRDIRFEGPTYEVQCRMEIGGGADDALVLVSNTPDEYRSAVELLLDAEPGPSFAGGTIIRSCQLPEENGCGVGWVDDEIAIYVGVEDELTGGIEPDEIESLLVARLPGLVDELAG